MINANEIRVGNWLNDPRQFNEDTKKFFKITDNGYFKATARDIQYAEEFNPIPLTEEILLKCGFEKTSESGYCGSDEEHKDIYSCGLVDIAFSDNNFYLWVSIDDDPYYSFCWTKIEYVHKLQNIVFAISGTELEINL